MKKNLRVFALVVLAAAVGIWAVIGSTSVWTKTQVQVKTGYDEFLQQDITAWKHRFVPGLDFLAAACVAAGILTGVSFLFRTKSNSINDQTNT